jgi:NTP pyrophosphatase (non-canonical NTP hydrolase)
MTVNELVKASHDNAVAKGFYGDDGEGERNIGELLMLITSELGECLKADRHGEYTKVPIENYSGFIDAFYPEMFEHNIKDKVEDKLADAVIRIAAIAGYLGIDLESHILAKMRYNATREKLHGKKY